MITTGDAHVKVEKQMIMARNRPVFVGSTSGSRHRDFPSSVGPTTFIESGILVSGEVPPGSTWSSGTLTYDGSRLTSAGTLGGIQEFGLIGSSDLSPDPPDLTDWLRSPVLHPPQTPGYLRAGSGYLLLSMIQPSPLGSQSDDFSVESSAELDMKVLGSL
ncbi:uncharacterized protein PITG_19599 [Phytophthora infestans T30-4]|uniref:Uncharacterized protein n=1 Tax=Phytophthora infestans (strain T30-4) TaxID=403677 RepID=D0P0V7_PHYIT|nr:uncharacterized protein PITG_19599 [Phytophthora infestans T30-4]EEY53079.1 hypothetical protein PITG_19599 [Phytophthora infestans T30-4]|eukprot:XP_002896073.1 hypothetical protein PITG_19599 [Phytophthora infestans T30-4]